MKTLKDNFNSLRNQMAHLRHSQIRESSAIAEEQTEQEEHVDPFMNPVLGVYVVRHTVGRRPRRA